MTPHSYGWLPQHPDFRDKKYIMRMTATSQPLPSRVDLRPGFPDVYDQLSLGSCTANAIVGAVEYDELKQGNNHVQTQSRLYLYYYERLMEGTVNEDSGAMIRDGIKVAAKGLCSETMWPYDQAKWRTRPSRIASLFAREKALVYEALDSSSIDQLKDCLASGYPFVFGFTVYDSLETDAVAHSGRVPFPSQDETVLGGHAVLAVGYNDSDDEGRFVFRNSWGRSWGMNGYGTLPYEYLTNPDLAADFWVIRSVSK